MAETRRIEQYDEIHSNQTIQHTSHVQVDGCRTDFVVDDDLQNASKV